MVTPAEFQSARIGSSRPVFRRENFLLFDPDKPLADPNQLLSEQGGRLEDPRSINHNCPTCNRTMTYDLFVAHARACYTKWRKVKLDITRKVFTGGGPRGA